MIKVIAFQREGKAIIAQVYSRYMEPLGNHTGFLEVFFCEDSSGRRYRVPKPEVLVMGSKTPKSLRKKQRKQRNEKRRVRVV